MKNIHTLPTDKPSRLCIDNSCNELNYSEIEGLSSKHITNQHIFITSDEEIKEGDWFLVIGGIGLSVNTYHKSHGCTPVNDWLKKIILTTDQDLIADGVQAIEDEFLEWFVQNPSCEFADVNDWLDDNGTIAFGGDKRYQLCNHLYNKEIIPKEPKQECCQDVSGFYLGTTCSKCNKPFRSIIQEPKQETLEEFIDKVDTPDNFDQFTFEEGIRVGVKWQQNRSYSEAIEFAEWIRIKDLQTTSKDNWIGLDMKYYTSKELFEQFKKKTQ